MFEHELKNAYIGEYGWKPWANTLLYMPLNWDTKDEVSGNNGTWSWNTQYQTLSSWLKVANCDTWSYILTPSISMNTALTLNVWMYHISWDAIVRCDWQENPRNFYQSAISPTGAWWGWYYGSTYYWWGLDWTNWWKNIVLTCWSWWIDVYVNWTNIYHNWNITSFVWKTQQRWINVDQSKNVWASWRIPWSWYYSNIIVENKVRTAQEISDYYNLTKSNYWL